MDKFRMGRFGEDKVFLPLKSSFPQNECNWITVGIGGDDQVERLFKEKYPDCRVFGVEASPDQYAHFDIYGTVIPFGVGGFQILVSSSNRIQIQGCETGVSI